MQLKAKKALLWLSIDVFGSQVIPFAAFLVIARLVSPEEYGSFALAMSCVGLLNIILYQGLAEGLIRTENPDETQLSTGFWLNVLLATVILVVINLAAAPIARIYHAPQMETLLRWLALLAPLQALASVHVALFRRHLETMALARRTLIGRVSGGATGIVLALAGFGVWSLVALQLVQAGVALAILWTSSSWRPRLAFSRSYAKELLHFGSHFLGGSIAASVVSSIDSLIVGLFFTPELVGIYMLASRLIEMVTTLLLVPMRLLIMPVLSRAFSKLEEFNSAYEGMIVPAYMVWLPFVLLMGVAVELLLPPLFGAKWIEAVPIVVAMTLSAFSTPLWYFGGPALSAAGRPDLYLKVACIQIAVTGICVLVGSAFSLEVVAISWALSSALMVPITFAALHRACGFHWSRMLPAIFKIALAGAPLAVLCFFGEEMGDILSVKAQIAIPATAAIGLALYLALLEFLLLPGTVTNAIASFREVLLPHRTDDRPLMRDKKNRVLS